MVTILLSLCHRLQPFSLHRRRCQLHPGVAVHHLESVCLVVISLDPPMHSCFSVRILYDRNMFQVRSRPIMDLYQKSLVRNLVYSFHVEIFHLVLQATVGERYLLTRNVSGRLKLNTPRLSIKSSILTIVSALFTTRTKRKRTSRCPHRRMSAGVKRLPNFFSKGRRENN